MHTKDIILLIASVLAVFIGAALMSGRNPEFRFLNVFEKHKNQDLGFGLALVSLFGLGYSFYSMPSFDFIIVIIGAVSWVSILIIGLRRPIHHQLLRYAEISLASLFIVWIALFDRRLIGADIVLLLGLIFWLLALATSSRKSKTP